MKKFKCSDLSILGPQRGSSLLFWLWSGMAPSATTTSEMDGPRSWGAATPWCATWNTTPSSSSDTSGAGSRWATCSASTAASNHRTAFRPRGPPAVSEKLSVPQVMIDIDGQHEWRDCLDLPGVQLPRGYYFGATALTGDLSGRSTLQCPKPHQNAVFWMFVPYSLNR